jgi:hypothetical protein
VILEFEMIYRLFVLIFDCVSELVGRQSKIVGPLVASAGDVGHAGRGA